MKDIKLWVVPLAAIIIVFGMLSRETRRFDNIMDMMEEVVIFANEMREIHSFMRNVPEAERLILHTELMHDHGEIARSVNELKAKIVGKSPEGWHRHDMGLWCEEFKEVNPGINCPNPWGMPSYIEMINGKEQTSP